jgi:threonine aldolase
VETDECNATGFFAHGVKVVSVAAPQGKLSPETIGRAATDYREVHSSKPRVVSLTQATESGTVYSRDELAAICRVVRKHDLRVHMDGARLANAVASLGVAPKEITWRAGVDVLCFGGTKNGMAFGEALVFFNRDAAREFEYRRKQAGQLASKMRYAAAQWIALLEDGAWLRNAKHANAMAALMAKLLRPLRGVRVVYPRQANAVFVAMPQKIYDGLHRRGWEFYTDVGPENAARLMCSWDTTEEDVRAFAKDAAELVKL